MQVQNIGELQYRIVPSKRPWALVAHARKIMGGRLHGGAL